MVVMEGRSAVAVERTVMVGTGAVTVTTSLLAAGFCFPASAPNRPASADCVAPVTAEDEVVEESVLLVLLGLEDEEAEVEAVTVIVIEWSDVWVTVLAADGSCGLLVT